MATHDHDFVMIEGGDAEEAPAANDYLDSISNHVENLSSDLRHISLSIHDHPELQFKEYHAHRVLTEYLQMQDGWKVTPSAYGIETAFVAVYDRRKKGPVVSFNAEYGTPTSVRKKKDRSDCVLRCSGRHRSRLWAQLDRHCLSCERTCGCQNARGGGLRWQSRTVRHARRRLVRLPSSHGSFSKEFYLPRHSSDTTLWRSRTTVL